MSKFQLCTTLGGRKNAEKPKREFSEFFGSVGSVFRSVRSILRPRVVVDRSGDTGAHVLAKVLPECKNLKNYRIDRIELDKKSNFFRFGFSVIFRPPIVVRS